MVGHGARLGEGAFLGMLSFLPPGTVVGPGSRWLGNPATEQPATLDDDGEADTGSEGDPTAVGAAWGWVGWLDGLVEVWLLTGPAILTLATFLLLEANAETEAGKWFVEPRRWALAAALLVMLKPIKLWVALHAKWALVGTLEAGLYPRAGPRMRRKRVWDRLLTELQLTVLPDMQGSPLLPAWLRACGARIGAGCCIQTPFFSEPDLCHVGAGVSLGEGAELQAHLVQGDQP